MAETSRDVALIQDEDVLRKMWQDTEDFGRKKEIRAHMYKLREARLRDFYNSGEVNKDIQQTTTKTTESKSCTHADSLADHSFISMKTKEIRDSESPTRDVSYRVTGTGLGNQGWSVVNSNKTSDDGKTFTTTKVATTSGTEAIQGGKIDYNAKNEQQASVYRDGDDKNFTKAVGASSNTFIKQEASGGDDNSSFRSSATKTSSSSKYVTEQRSSSGDVTQTQTVPSRSTNNQNEGVLISRKIYTDDDNLSEFKNHPSYVDGKTKVTRETRTLPDGTTVTTTRYEVKSGGTTQSSKSTHSEQKSSATSTTQQKSTVNTSQTNETRTNQNSTTIQPTTTTCTKYIYDSRDQELQPSTTTTRIIKTSSTKDSIDDSTKNIINRSQTEPQKDVTTTTKTTVVRNIYDSKEPTRIVTTSTKDQQRVLDSVDSNKTIIHRSQTEPQKNVTTTIVRNIYDSKEEPTRIVTTSTKDQQRVSDSVDSNKTIIHRSQTEPQKDVTTTTIVRNIYDSREEPTRIVTTSSKDQQRVSDIVDDSTKRVVHRSQIEPQKDVTTTTTKTTIVKNIYDSRDEPSDKDSNRTIRTTVVKNIDNNTDIANKRVVKDVYNTDDSKTVTKTSRTEQINDAREDKIHTKDHSIKISRHQDNEKFINVEKNDTEIRAKPSPSPDRCAKPEKQKEVPEKRQPIKPGKSELDVLPKPTEGQYETTYRTEFTNKRISVEVSPTHDAFARSLRAVSPGRRSLRSSTSSLRSSTSPEKNRHPTRYSPERRSVSPRKTTSNETITHRNRVCTDTRVNSTTEIDSSTLTRKKNRTKTRSRSPSPTSIASDIEFIANNVVTDLDTNETIIVTQERPRSIEVTRKTTKKVTDRFATSPLLDKTSPKKSDAPRRTSLRNVSPTKEPSPSRSDRPLKRTDTYEERCRQILGITNETEKRKDKLEKTTINRNTTVTKSTTDRKSPTKESPGKKIQEFPSQIRKSPEKKYPETGEKYPHRKSPEKESPRQHPSKKDICEFPSQIRKSPEKEPGRRYPAADKEPSHRYPDKKKDAPSINEFPAQIRKSPEKEPGRRYPATDDEPSHRYPDKTKNTISEFPSQIKKSPEKEPGRRYPANDDEPSRRYPDGKKDAPTICEFPSQVRKSPEKEPGRRHPGTDNEPSHQYPNKKKDAPAINEFPAQIRKSPEKEPGKRYPATDKEPSHQLPDNKKEAPSQIRKSPEKEPGRRYPATEDEPSRRYPDGKKDAPSQIRKSPEKEPGRRYPAAEDEPTGRYPDGKKDVPSQIRKSPEKEPGRKYPANDDEPSRRYPDENKDVPTICEFPSQVRRSPEKEPERRYPGTDDEPSHQYPDKKKDAPTINEFPAQIRKSPEKEPGRRYPTTNDEPSHRYPAENRDAPTICEFPSQIRKSPEKEPGRRYPATEDEPSLRYPDGKKDVPTQIRTEKEPGRRYPADDDEPSRRYPDEKKDAPTICEFPSQVRKSSEKEPGRRYPATGDEPFHQFPDKTKNTPTVSEFPSQIRKSPEKEPGRRYPAAEDEPTGRYPEGKKDSPSQICKSPEKEPRRGYPATDDEPSRRYPDGKKDAPTHIRKSPEKEPGKRYPADDDEPSRRYPDGKKDAPTPIRKSPEKEPGRKYPADDDEPTGRYPDGKKDAPSQIRKSPEKEPGRKYPADDDELSRRYPVEKKDAPNICEFPSQVRRSPENEPGRRYPATDDEPSHQYPDKKKDAPTINEFPSQIRKSPEKEPERRYPATSEFPPQIRKTLDYPETTKDEPSVTCEFPSQIRRSPEEQPFEDLPVTKRPVKDTPEINEFPSQIRKTPEKGKSRADIPKISDLLVPGKSPSKDYPKSEIPRGIIPSKTRPSTDISEISTLITKSSGEIVETETDKLISQVQTIHERRPSQKPHQKESPVRRQDTTEIYEVSHDITTTEEEEIYSDEEETKEKLVRKSPEKEPSRNYPERRRPDEFTSQIRKTEETEDSYTKVTTNISDLPSQLRKSPEKKPADEENQKPAVISEFPSQVRKTQEKYQKKTESTREVKDINNKTKPSKQYPEEQSPKKRTTQAELYEQQREASTKINKISTHVTKTADKQLLKNIPRRETPIEDTDEYLPQVTAPSEEYPTKKYPKTINGTVIVTDTCIISSEDESHTTIRKVPPQIKPGKDVPKSRPTEKRKPEKIDSSPETKRLPTKPSEGNKPQIKSPTKVIPEKTKPKEKEYSPAKSRPTKEPQKITEFPSQIKKTPDKRFTEKSPKSTETPSPKKLTTLCPTSPSKRDRPRQRTRSLSSSSTEQEEVIEESTFTTVSELEGKIPVNEPLVTQRFISQLCRDDEIQRQDLTKVNKTVLNKEVLETEDVTRHKTVKKDLSKTTRDSFIENEREDTNTKYHSPRATSPNKKQLPEKNKVVGTDRKLTTTIKTTTKKTVTEDKPKIKDVRKTTLYNVENVSEVKQDTRTHRIDETVNKKSTRTVVNGDVTKKPVMKRPTKVDEPKPKKPIEKKPVVGKSVTEIESRRTTEQKTPRRHVVTTTITVNSKARPSPAKITTKTTPKDKKKVNEEVSSDSESIADSLDEEVIEEISIERQRDKGVTKDRIIKKTPTKSPSKPTSLPSKTKQEKKCITTKSIIINNEANEREVIVNLQRSKSSREPTPDRICPLPVSSDEETTPRYPDHVTEPEDSSTRHKPKRISDIPITEDEDVAEFNRITEISDTVDRVEDTDESLLSVNKKINIFLDTAEKVTKTKQGPAPKVQRPKLEVDKNLESDDCLLSVSEKVSKFITTAEQLTAPQDYPQRPKSPKCQSYPREEVYVTDFITTGEEIVAPQKGTVPKSERPKTNDKVSKFTEKVTVSLSKIDPKPTQKLPERGESPRETTPTRKAPTETTPTRRPPQQYTSIKTEIPESKYTRRETSPKLVDSTPKSTRRPSEDEPKSVLSPSGRLRSTETVKKAKALFENISKDHQTSKQRDILSRPSVFEGRKVKTETAKKLEYDSDEEKVSKSRSRPKSSEKVPETISRRSQTPDSDVPGYMRPLDRSLRTNSPHRESVSQLSQLTKKHSFVKDEETTDVRETKFGVTLKRTDSGRAVTTSTNLAKSRVTTEISEAEIEEIYELEVLEELLEKVTDYELRRKIRAQIRLVKKLISEGKLTEVITRKFSSGDKVSMKTTKQSKEAVHKTTTEYKSYSYDERRSSSEYTQEIRRSQSPDTKPSRGKSPEKSSVTSKVFQTQLKKTSPSKATLEDNRPEWVKQRNLKKQTDTTVSTKSSTTTTKKSRSSPSRESKPIDIITSSYGVGPTDENGSPLFGLKALRSRNVADTTTVKGTVIRSQYYSENGHEPVGEISVTTYSNDPKELGRDEDERGKGITSVTTTQKFGYKDTPSLKTITTTKKNREICEDEESTTKSTRVSRRGSVKALSQKFIENAVETSKSERQSSYPKAGLILRTSSFKDSASSGDSREGSAERTVTVKTTKSVAGETFLTNRSKVTGVQDVISRMKTEDVREGDTVEEVEARGLLNKFIGSQVILSGLESNAKTTTSSAKRTTKVTTTVTEGGKPTTKTRLFQHPISEEELESVWDEQTLRLLLEQSTDYDERRRIRARLRQVMAEQEACTELVEKASQDQISTTFEGATGTKKTVTEGPVTTSQVTTRVTTQQISKKPVSPFAKFRQLDKQNSLNSPSTPKTPSGSGPLFKFTDPAVSQSASTIKDRLLHWCRMKTKEYENIQLDNFSTSWADGLAFCALIHHFLPDAFDYHALTPKNRRHNFTLAFQVADEKADIAPLLDVDDMVATRKPDWKCVFTYVQSIYRRFKDED